MTTQASALAILDRWQYHMDHPDAPPLEIHHTDLDVIRQALTKETWPRGRYPRPGRLQPLLSVGNTCIGLSERLLEELGHPRQVMVGAEGGRPYLRPYPGGYTVTQNSHGVGGMLLAPPLVQMLGQHLGTGTRWLMQRDGDCWRGSKIE